MKHVPNVTPPTEEYPIWIFRVDDLDYHVESTAADTHFSTPDCICYPIFIPGTSSIIVGGEDDCPVHGFGD